MKFPVKLLQTLKSELIAMDYPMASEKSDEEIQQVLSPENRYRIITWLFSQFGEPNMDTISECTLQSLLVNYGCCREREKSAFFGDPKHPMDATKQFCVFKRIFQKWRCLNATNSGSVPDEDSSYFITSILQNPTHLKDIMKTKPSILPTYIIPKHSCPNWKTEQTSQYITENEMLNTEINNIRLTEQSCVVDPLEKQDTDVDLLERFNCTNFEENVRNLQNTLTDVKDVELNELPKQLELLAEGLQKTVKVLADLKYIQDIENYQQLEAATKENTVSRIGLLEKQLQIIYRNHD